MQNVTLFSQLKLRAGYGVVGNQDISNYAFQTLYGSKIDNGNALISNDGRRGNPDLTWEKQKQANVGIDMAFFKSRLTVTADFYSINNDNLLLDRTLATTSGYKQQWENIGRVNNKGMEYSVIHIEHVLYNEAEKLLQEKVDEHVTHFMMDIRMPHISGIELCAALKKTYGTRVKYVALTAHVLPEEQEALLGQGFDIVLSKPFREEDLANLLGLTVREAHESSNRSSSIDIAALRKMTFDDEGLFQSVINQFVVDTTSDLHRLNNALVSHDITTIRETIHKLTGRIGQMGARNISDKLHRIEKRIDSGETLDTLLTDTRNSEQEVEKLVVEVKQLESLKL
jgi:CheY-like chemotaxis protein